MFHNISLKEFFAENKWLLAAAIFFVLWKFFLVSLLWQDRIHPPEPDDAYIYINHIESVVACPSFLFCDDQFVSFSQYSGFDHLTYRLFFGVLARILHIDSLAMFHASFYIGLLIAVGIFWQFLTVLTPHKKLAALAFFFLAFYNGAGSYHGLYWVVPSFFSTLLFFLILTIVLDPKKSWKIPILILVPLALFTHILFLYLIIFFLPTYFIFSSWFEKKIDLLLLKKVVFTLTIALLAYFPVFNHVTQNASGGVPYGPTAALQQVASNTASLPQISSLTFAQRILSYMPDFPSFHRFIQDYIFWIFPHWLAAVLFLWIIFILFIHKQHVILSLFFSAFLFSLLSTLHEFGYRSLIILWPLTFLLYAFGAYFSFIWLYGITKTKQQRWIISTLFLFTIGMFSALNITYSLYWNIDNNQKNNITLPPEALLYIRSLSPTKKLAFDSSIITSYLSLQHITLSSPLVKYPTDADYYITVNKFRSSHSSDITPTLYTWLSLIYGQKPNLPPSDKITSDIPKDFEVEKDFTFVTIYKHIYPSS